MAANTPPNFLSGIDWAAVEAALANPARISQPHSALARYRSQTFPPSSNVFNALFGHLTATLRSRSDWNDRFDHWERPASVTETANLERARSMVAETIAANPWLDAQGVTVRGQGSYYNNTNVRTEADIDLRVVHPNLKVEYADNVIAPYARTALTYTDAPLTLDQIFAGLRTSLITDFDARFGKANVDVGNKAIRLKGVMGSRAEVDIVPAVGFHWVYWNGTYNAYGIVEGVAILGRDGRWTVNFPEQHAANSRTKRERTSHRFKKIVRVFKRLCSEMSEVGLLTANVPSFLIESLVYAVEDTYFLVPTDDYYARVRRIAYRMQTLLSNSSSANELTEVNGVKRLFGSGQAWSYQDAKTFADCAVSHLGNA